MPAFLPRKKACGLKRVSGFPTNVPRGLPTFAALIILYNPETGMPLAVMVYPSAISLAAMRALHPVFETSCHASLQRSLLRCSFSRVNWIQV
jgi:hypothetical protein